MGNCKGDHLHLNLFRLSMARLYYSRLSQDVIVKLSKIGSFGAPRFKKVNSQILDVHFQVTHLRTCGKVWFSNHRGRRSEKRKNPRQNIMAFYAHAWAAIEPCLSGCSIVVARGCRCTPGRKLKKWGRLNLRG